MDSYKDIIQYCQMEMIKAKGEYKSGKMSIKELQRLAKTIDNIQSFVIMKKQESGK